MTKLEVLLWGVQHIAKNHGFTADVEDPLEYYSVCINGVNVPTLSDCRALCGDLGIPECDCYEDKSWGATIIDFEPSWAYTRGTEQYIPTGNELWKLHDAVIGK